MTANRLYAAGGGTRVHGGPFRVVCAYIVSAEAAKRWFYRLPAGPDPAAYNRHE